MKRSLPANPFKFGDPVEGDFYLPRPELSATVCHFLENRIHTVLMGPRRFGKTSFSLNLLQQLEEAGYHTLFVDIFNITSHKDFLHQLLRALKTKEPFWKAIKSWLAKVKRLGPQISAEIDPSSGHPKFHPTLASLGEENIKIAIQDILEKLSHLGAKVVVAIDEFQKISEIDDKGWLEATLRSHFQHLKNVAFLFTGSRKSLISEMLNTPSRPLYRSCQVIEFPTFGDEFTNWVIGRFSTIGIDCDKTAIEHLRHLVQDTPNYVQMVCFHLVAQARAQIGFKEIEEVLETVVRQNAYAYQTLLNSLTLAQQRALRLAANEKESLFQKERLLKYEITSAPALHSSIHALKAKGLLDEEGTRQGRVLFDDPLFAIWLRLCFND
ncbi:MAG: hypothetical protein S4CHLAM2_03950 [Chlamydiales bacterium]|nr:hypothetical protein [Chlamydiales bacterium]